MHGTIVDGECRISASPNVTSTPSDRIRFSSQQQQKQQGISNSPPGPPTSQSPDGGIDGLGKFGIPPAITSDASYLIPFEAIGYDPFFNIQSNLVSIRPQSVMQRELTERITREHQAIYWPPAQSAASTTSLMTIDEIRFGIDFILDVALINKDCPLLSFPTNSSPSNHNSHTAIGAKR